MNQLNLIFDFMEKNYDLIFGAMGLIEIVLRLIPTSKNLSIIENVVKVLGFFIKNRRKPSPLDNVVGENPKLNLIKIDRTKFII